MLVRVETLSPDLSRGLPHLRQSGDRQLGQLAQQPGYTEFDEVLAAEFPTSTAADFAILEAGVTSEQTYVDQGLYWSRSARRMLRYVARTYRPDLFMVGMPTTDEFQHEFLGLVTKTLANGSANPAFDDVNLDEGA